MFHIIHKLFFGQRVIEFTFFFVRSTVSFEQLNHLLVQDVRAQVAIVGHANFAPVGDDD